MRNQAGLFGRVPAQTDPDVASEGRKRSRLSCEQAAAGTQTFSRCVNQTLNLLFADTAFKYRQRVSATSEPTVIT
jgi:hypothetical protein